MDASKEPLKVLCLDGGGCRCYAQLQMLAKVLQNTQPRLTEQDALALRPCDYFDLIVGTSAGGLLAIMLGRLSMTLGEAFHHFNVFKRKVFEDDKGLKQMLLKGERFDLERMRQAVKDVLQGEDGLLMKSEDSGCYVCRFHEAQEPANATARPLSQFASRQLTSRARLFQAFVLTTTRVQPLYLLLDIFGPSWKPLALLQQPRCISSL
jgi:predicted acylesterase/phospholipase RssA